MGWESPSHWVIIAIVVVVLFGYKKLPEMSRSVGRSLRIFKTEMKGMGEDDSARGAAEHASAGQQITVTPAPAPTQPVPPQTAGTVGTDAMPAPAAEAPREAPQQQTQA
jgi:sec-independent protein translocase protein TatA